jgi:hypothetical protein
MWVHVLVMWREVWTLMSWNEQKLKKENREKYAIISII